MLGNVLLMQATAIALGFAFTRALLGICRRLGMGESTLLLAQVPVAALAVGLAALSYATFVPSLAVLFGTIGFVFWSLCLWTPLLALRAMRRAPAWKQVWLGGASIAFLAVGTHALFIEPFDVRVERVPIEASRLERPLRILHLSDLQTSWFGTREERALRRIGEQQPDLVVITGDYVSGRLDREAGIRSARRVLSALAAPLGVFAVSGDSETDAERERVFDELPITWLRNESRRLDVPGTEIHVVGLENAAPSVERGFAAVPDGAFTILLHHSPDVVFSLEGRRPDLLLAGHTHGGQVALPIAGAPLTLTRLGPRYASGLLEWEGIPMYVSRGIGVEGGLAPPIRFNCPPEIALLELRPAGRRASPARSH
jgi:predicted MPP superfamily phosphohydrolase